MKFKKSFAWILSVAMVITLIPGMAFATSTNTVTSTPTVAADDKMPAISMDIEIKDNSGWSSPQTIKLTFNNAEWTNKPSRELTTAGAIQAEGKDVLTISGTAGMSPSINKVISYSDNSIEFTIDPGTGQKGQYITLKFAQNALTSGSEDGPVEIAIDGLDSSVSSSTLTVATVGSGNTVATVNGDVKTFGRAPIELPTTIEIRETAVNSISGSQVIKLTLPKGISWEEVILGGNLINDKTITYSTKNQASSPNDVLISGNPYFGSDNRSAYVYVPVNNPNASVREVLTVTGKINIGKDASQGDITVDVESYRNAENAGSISDASDLVVAVYGEESVTVSTVAEEDIPTIYSGYVQTNKDKYNWVQVTIKENVKGSLESGRYVDFAFPEEIQVVNSEGITQSFNKNAKLKDASSKDSVNNVEYDNEGKLKTSEFTLKVPEDGAVADGKKWDKNAANTWNIFIPVTVRADFTGDIELSIKGAKAGIDDTTLTVAKAESPIKVETKTTEVKNGIQSQALADITITENVAGYLSSDSGRNKVVLDIDDLNLEGISLTDAKVEVTSGNLEISNVKKANSTITFDIKEESTQASTISIKGVVAALNRTLPEGPYALQVYGSALIDNNDYNDKDFADPQHDGDVCAAKVADYINIVTPADTSTRKINATFVLRQTTYTVNGVTQEMDTAPYLDANNRTLVPIRYAAIACGVPESDISWDQAAQTATINGGNTVVKITIGSNILQTSTGNITMDTAAVSDNGRIFVPVRYIANALGANVGWDQETKTITLTN